MVDWSTACRLTSDHQAQSSCRLEQLPYQLLQFGCIRKLTLYQLTNWLKGIESIVNSLSGNSQQFMESVDKLPYSHGLATDSCCEIDEPSSHPPQYFFQTYFHIILPYALSSSMRLLFYRLSYQRSVSISFLLHASYMLVPSHQPCTVHQLIIFLHNRKGIGLKFCLATDYPEECSLWFTSGHTLYFRPRSRYFCIQVAPQLSSRGWVDPVPDAHFLRKSGRAWNRTRDLWICSQKLRPLDHRGVTSPITR
jgi:hypothetical protein